MSTRDKRKCFTFTWTIENISYNCQRRDKSIESPTFVTNVEQESVCFLYLYLKEDRIVIFLHRKPGQSLNKIDCELAFLSKDGAVLESREKNNVTNCTNLSMARKEIFVVYGSAYLPEDKLIARCRIWKSDGELEEDVQCFARSRICIKREAFLWNIKNFSSLRSEEKCTYHIKSMSDNEVLMTLDFLLKNPYTDEDSINIQLASENGKIKYFVLHLMPLNGFGSANQGIRKEFLFSDNEKPKLFTLPFSKQDLVADKNLCLPNDVLSFRFECTFSTGDIIEEIESVIYGCESLASIEPVNESFDEENTLSVSKRILNDDLKSLFHDNIFSDIKLKSSTKTFPAHKNILSARSPVFKAMFSNNMKEKFNECVEIEDIDSDTVFRMLHYVYTAEIQDLQWENACDLYRAADKYEILALRDECSACIKSNLSPNNACEVLILADMHQDEYLKASVQEFIFNHDVLISEEWKHLMKTRAKLAADTMYLQIQRKLSMYQI
ncbi:TD and POZ domain-containing protein 3 [Araneus ventricosus]|uniref:TD and POZ domain-containing protein 3 n=1 Tax=Araneus ventricosus TaxID=182803 RepID=A0A4Y2A9X2_ARAVE|nr:TD and POZ domain-containing protein 3 [Araneus ventricosus]